eukprot:scaffold86659_cov45-Phaeocystis_antarctica.AAC.1
MPGLRGQCQEPPWQERPPPQLHLSMHRAPSPRCPTRRAPCAGRPGRPPARRTARAGPAAAPRSAQVPLPPSGEIASGPSARGRCRAPWRRPPVGTARGPAPHTGASESCGASELDRLCGV